MVLEGSSIPNPSAERSFLDQPRSGPFATVTRLEICPSEEPVHTVEDCPIPSSSRLMLTSRGLSSSHRPKGQDNIEFSSPAASEMQLPNSRAELQSWITASGVCCNDLLGLPQIHPRPPECRFPRDTVNIISWWKKSEYSMTTWMWRLKTSSAVFFSVIVPIL